MKGGCLSVQRGSTARLPSAFTHFITVSDIGIKVLLIPENIENLDYSREISFPDEPIAKVFFCGSTSSPRTEKVNDFNLSPFTLSLSKGKLRTFAITSDVYPLHVGSSLPYIGGGFK